MKTSNDLSSVFNRRDSFHHVFYNGNRIDELFLYIFPIDKLEHISRIFSAIETASGSAENDLLSYGGIHTKKENLISSFETINSYLKQSIASQGFNIFYSWQSDLPNNTNRSFIESALEKVIGEASKELTNPFSMDKDTSNRTGSPDKTGKKTSDPNVLFELGYAQGVLGEENIIMAFNNAFGNIEDLPFDLRGKRIMQYTCNKDMSDTEKVSTKSELVKQLSRAIKLRGKAEIR